VADAAGVATGAAHEDSHVTTELRIGLQLWLGKVATFQQVDVVHQMYTWFQHASAEEVGKAMKDLLKADPSSGWSTCAIEDENCECPSGKIRYGHVEKRWLDKKIGEPKFWCSLGNFGGQDVAVGMLKQCQCWQELDTEIAINALSKIAEASHRSDSFGKYFWSALTSPFKWASLALSRRAQQAATLPDAVAEQPIAGELWQRLHQLERWMSTNATHEQLALVAIVYKWLENTGQRAKIGVALSKAAASHIARNLPLCEDGKPVDAKRCPGFGQNLCRAGCSRKPPLESVREQVGGRIPRSDLCKPGVVLEPLWSCDRATARVPSQDHAHAQPQHVLDKSVEMMCENEQMRDQMAVYLDCEFLQPYLKWTTDESEWLEEAYVTYVGGQKDSTYEWQAMNLVRSIDIFSNRPVVVTVFGNDFVPPDSWRDLPNVIVYRMKPVVRGVSFNFNKMRSMICSRVVVGIQLDTDQIIAPAFDKMFAGTRREINANYPWIMMPVHWMSRESKKPEPYWEYAFRDWSGKRTMRWGHAHPTWSYWALPFLCDMTFERFSATMRPGSIIDVWNLPEAQSKGLLQVLEAGRTANRKAKQEAFMNEDEDMMNVALWRDGVTKDWCKYDLEWGLYKDRMKLDKRMYWDTKWYPDGLPVIFISMHNTKPFEITDWLLSLYARCDIEPPKLSCPPGHQAPRFCEAGSTDERKVRQTPNEYIQKLCCCLEPRQQTNIFWGGQWFENPEQVPMKLQHMKKERTCLFP